MTMPKFSIPGHNVISYIDSDVGRQSEYTALSFGSQAVVTWQFKECHSSIASFRYFLMTSELNQNTAFIYYVA
jgi:hypothetical protein